MDIISRDVMRVLLPSGLQPTLVRDGKQYVELVVSTPNGVSNRFPIPFGPPSAPQPTPEPLNVDTGYTLMDDLLKLGANVTPAIPSRPPAHRVSATTIQTTQTIQVTQGGQPAQGSGGGNQAGAGGGQGTRAGQPAEADSDPREGRQGDADPDHGQDIPSQSVRHHQGRFPLPRRLVPRHRHQRGRRKHPLQGQCLCDR